MATSPKTKEQLDYEIAELTATLKRRRPKIAWHRRRIHALKAQQQRTRAKIAKRRKAKRELAHDTLQRQCYDAAHQYIGVTEKPPGSNTGPTPIDECQREFGYHGVAWCGCFVGWILRRVAGMTAIGAWIAYTPSIKTNAEAGHNGWRAVPQSAAEFMDVLVFDWKPGTGADHTGFFVRWIDKSRGIFESIEGNTSFDDYGSQSDGGAVAERKTRTMAMVCCVARPPWGGAG